VRARSPIHLLSSKHVTAYCLMWDLLTENILYVPSTECYGPMTYGRCGKSGLHSPAISLGLWHNFDGTSSLGTGRAMLRRAFDLGITHFDLAKNYGPPYSSAEENFGRLIKSIF